MRVHDYKTSQNEDDAHWWADIYRQWLPGYQRHEVVTDVRMQRSGIDHLVFAGGDAIKVDAKTRPEKNYNDVAFEVWSNKERGVPSWLLKPDAETEWVAYAMPASGWVLMIPFAAMRQTNEENKHCWAELCNDPRSGFRRMVSHNTRYDTTGVCVPCDVVERIPGTTKIFFDGSPPVSRSQGSPLKMLGYHPEDCCCRMCDPEDRQCTQLRAQVEERN